MLYLWIKYLHIVGAVVIFGTGLGTAFQMWMAHRGRDPRSIATVARNVMVADWVFTTPAVVLQPITGLTLAVLVGHAIHDGWLILSLVLYGIAAACWLPVVWLQIRMARIARETAERGGRLPPAYWRMARVWFWLGWPAFVAVLVILHLMVFRPDI